MALRNTNLILGTTVLPVKVSKATDSPDIKFNLCTPDGGPVSQVYQDEQGICYTRSECGKAYEGVQIDSELVAAIDEECKLSDIEVVPMAESNIPWHLAQGFYYIHVDKKASANIKSIFRVIGEAAKAEKVALVGKWTPRSRQAILAIRYDGEKFIACELAFASDVRTPSEDILVHLEAQAPKEIVKQARELLTLLKSDSHYESLVDEALPKRQALIEEAMKSGSITKTEKKMAVVSTLDALEQTLAEAVERARA